MRILGIIILGNSNWNLESQKMSQQQGNQVLSALLNLKCLKRKENMPNVAMTSPKRRL